jgi:hypothetical protein
MPPSPTPPTPSCLVPVDVTGLPCLYVFVDIQIDVDHLVDCARLTFPPGARASPSPGCVARSSPCGALAPSPLPGSRPTGGRGRPPPLKTLPARRAPSPHRPQRLAGTRLLLAGTIQFSSAVQVARSRLAGDYPAIDVPKCKPLSPGEVRRRAASSAARPAPPRPCEPRQRRSAPLRRPAPTRPPPRRPRLHPPGLAAAPPPGAGLHRAGHGGGPLRRAAVCCGRSVPP